MYGISVAVDGRLDDNVSEEMMSFVCGLLKRLMPQLVVRSPPKEDARKRMKCQC
jgi:hypothetical protein